MIYEPFHEQQFSSACIEVDIRKNAFGLDLACEWRVGENNVKGSARVRGADSSGQRVMEADVRFFHFVQVHIQNGNLNHVGVIVKTSEGVIFKKLPLRGCEQVA